MTVRDQGEGTDTASDVETLLRRVVDIVGGARVMPLSTSVMVNRDDVLDLLDEALERLPEELRAARWLLKERDDFLRATQQEGDDILEEARVRAERMVQRSEVVRAAEHAARRIVDDAEAEARRLRNEAEDYCDRRLARFEHVLERTLDAVRTGRERLTTVPLFPPDEDDEPELDGQAFFDQDTD